MTYQSKERFRSDGFSFGGEDMEHGFEELITTQERLRELKGPPTVRSSKKATDRIDEIFRRFIAACPFVVVASRGRDGRLDLSPKGDPAGFIHVLMTGRLRSQIVSEMAGLMRSRIFSSIQRLASTLSSQAMAIRSASAVRAKLFETTSCRRSSR